MGSRGIQFAYRVGEAREISMVSSASWIISSDIAGLGIPQFPVRRVFRLATDKASVHQSLLVSSSVLLSEQKSQFQLLF